MDRSILGLPDPTPHAPHPERRRTVRQKLHTPVYVSFTGPQSGMVLDLSELVDLHENGFAVQTALPTGVQRNDRLEVNRAVTLCLDLPETRKYVHGSGQVMWIDDTGRAGIRFSFLPDSSRQILKEWLFANLLIASTNHAARVEQLAHHNGERASPSTGSGQALGQAQGRLSPVPGEPAPIAVPTPVPNVASPVLPDRAELLSALDDVRRQVRQIETGDPGDRADAVLRLITERAMGLTGATGAALAFLTGSRMLCRARVGGPAPPLGSEVDVRAGLSGECIRSGLLVTCEDPETDPRVDAEICRRFGIGSFMAAPICTDLQVVGLLEIFSPHPRSFTNVQGAILERLVELVPESTPGERASLRQAQGRLSPVPLATWETGVPARQGEQSSPAGPPAANPLGANAATSMPKHPDDAVVRPSVQDVPAPQPDVPQQDLDDAPPAASPRRSHFTHFVLLVLVFGTIAMVMGYLLAPRIEKRWLGPAQSSQNSTQNLEQSSKPVSEQPSSQNSSASSLLQDAADRRGHVLSPEDLRKLADQGDTDAQYQLGILYHDGDVIPKDDAQAVQWFERAAEQGYVRAQSTLGAYYWAGRGVPQDFSKAYFWSQLALAQGDENSKSRLEGLSAQMTQSQVANARQQAEAWLHAHAQGTQVAKPN